MTIIELRDYCMAKPGTTEHFPFDEHTLVFKVMNKMFCLAGLDRWETGDESLNVKCDPQVALELREKYPEAVLPGYHMNKKHWNTITANTDLTDKQIKHWINHSYELVVSSLPKKVRDELKTLAQQ